MGDNRLVIWITSFQFFVFIFETSRIPMQSPDELIKFSYKEQGPGNKTDKI